MSNSRIELIPEINFEIVKFSKKRGTEERFFAKNVVLDSGFNYLLDSAFESSEYQNLLVGIVQFPTFANLCIPRWLFLGTGTSEPQRSDTGLQAVSTMTSGRQSISEQSYGHVDRDPVTGEAWAELKRTFSWAEGEAEGTWTEAGLAFWDRIGHPSLRGNDNTYANPYSRSLFRKGLEKDSGTASAGGATTLSDATKAWDVDAWKDNYTVYITGGTGTGQSREITGNTATGLTVAAWVTPPDATSEYEIRGTPTSITVLADEYLTVFGYMRMYTRHQEDAWTGVLTYKGFEVPWRAYVNSSFVTNTWAPNSFAQPSLPNTFYLKAYPISTDYGDGTIYLGNSQIFSVDETFNKESRLCSGSFDLDPSVTERVFAWIEIRTNYIQNTFGYIIPDWSVLPDQHKKYAFQGGHERHYALWPSGERLKGTMSMSMFRGD